MAVNGISGVEFTDNVTESYMVSLKSIVSVEKLTVT